MKRLYGVYDTNRKLRYIGATVVDGVDKVEANIRLHLRDTKEELTKRSKRANRREILFARLVARDALRIRFLCEPRKDWMDLRMRLIKEARSRGMILANESDGGPGSSGVPVSPGSIKRAMETRARLTDDDAYAMHTMWRLRGMSHREIAEHFNLTVKGVQKILNGSRRPKVQAMWLQNHLTAGSRQASR